MNIHRVCNNDTRFNCPLFRILDPPLYVALAQRSVPVMYQPWSELHTYITSRIMPWELSPAKIIMKFSNNNHISLRLVQLARPLLLHSTNHFQYWHANTESNWCCGKKKVMLARLDRWVVMTKSTLCSNHKKNPTNHLETCETSHRYICGRSKIIYYLSKDLNITNLCAYLVEDDSPHDKCHQTAFEM